MQLLMSEEMLFRPLSIIFRYLLFSAENTKKVNCLVFILHGDLDESVPIAHAKTKGKLAFFERGTHENLPESLIFQNKIECFKDTIKL